MASSFVRMKCAILLNRSTTTMMASKPFEGGKLTIKSIDTLSHSPSGIGKKLQQTRLLLVEGAVLLTS
jgi:hypothetical protein